MPRRKPITQGHSAESEQAVEILHDQELRLHGTHNAQLAFARGVKESLLFKYNWGELLCAVPTSLSFIGICYVAANSSIGRTVNLQDSAPAGGFKYIKYPGLKAALIQVSDVGRRSFLTAAKNMDLVKNTSGSMKVYMTRIGQYLAQLPHPDAEDKLDQNLSNLKESADRCLEYTREIEEAFNYWLELVCELHQVAQAKEENTIHEQEQSSAEMKDTILQQQRIQDCLEQANQHAKDLKAHMDSTRELLKDTAAAMPGPWQSVGLMFADSVAGAVTTMITQGLSGKITRPFKSAVKGLFSSKGQLESAGSQGLSIPDSEDIAYAYAAPVATLLTALESTLGPESETGLDWETLAYSQDESSNFQMLKHLHTSLMKIRDTVAWSTRDPSLRLRNCIETGITYIEDLAKEIQDRRKQKSHRQELPLLTINSWRRGSCAIKIEAIKLASTAACLPGCAPGGAPISRNAAGTKGTVNRAAESTVLKIAQEKLVITEAAYQSAQQNYEKASERAQALDSQLDAVKTKLENANIENLTMKGIQEILWECMQALLQIKQQVSRLVEFFGALAAMVEYVVKEHVKDFLQQARSAEKSLLQGISLLDLSRQHLFTTSLICQAYLSLFSRIADMYTTVSLDHVMPALALCDQLSASTDDQSVKTMQMEQLNRFTNNSQRAIRRLVSNAKEEITEKLEKNVRLIAGDVKMLPPLEKPVLQAIEEGRKAGAYRPTHEVQRQDFEAVDTDEI